MTGHLVLPPTDTSHVYDVSEAIFLIDANYIIRFATPVAVQIHGYELDQITGRSALDFIAPEVVDAVEARWQAMLAAGGPDFDELRIPVLTTDARRLVIRASMWRLPGRDEFLLLYHALDHVRDRLETLYSMLNELSGVLELHHVLNVVLHEAHRLVPCDTATVFMIEPNDTIRVRRWHENRFEEYRTLRTEHLPEFETSRIIRETSKPLIINDTATDPRWTQLPDHRPIASWMGVPLIHRGEYFGELNLDSKQKNTFTASDGELALALSTQVAAALHNARQYENEQRRAKRYQAISEVSQAINHLDLENVLEVVYRKIKELMDTSSFFIALYDREIEQVRLAGAYDFDVRQPDAVQDANQGLIGEVLRTCERIIIDNTENETLPTMPIIEGDMPKSLMMVPLITQDQLLGVITVQSYQANAYSPEDAHLFETLADSVAIAVQNAQLFDETSARLAALEIMHQTGMQLAAVQTMDEVADLVIRAVMELFQPTQVRLVLCDETPGNNHQWIAHANTPAAPPQYQALDCAIATPSSLIKHVIRKQQPFIVADLNKMPDLQTEFQTPWLVQSVAAQPLRHGGQVRGVLVLAYNEPYTFCGETLRTLDLLSLQAITALENAQYTITLRRRLAEVTALQDLACRVSACQSLDGILHTVVQTLRDAYQCRASSIALLEADGSISIQATAGLDPYATEPVPFSLSEYVSREVVSSGQVIYVADAHADESFSLIDPDVRSLMAVPLMVQDRVIGALSIDSSQPNAFSRDHERVLTIAAGQIAATIDSVHRANELSEANARLEAQDELRKELVIQVSHDLRSPLGLVQGYAGLIRDEAFGGVNEEQSDALLIIERRAQSIKQLTEDILSTRPINHDMLELTEIDINALSQQSIADARIVFKDSSVHFETDLIPGEFIVMGDPHRLCRIFDNLLSNAVKFSPDGGTVTVRTRPDPETGYVQISISDQGIGIPPEKLPHIFERFYRGNKEFRVRFPGSGVGLFIVQQLVEAHHGTVWGESEMGQGSTFTIALPLAER